MINFRQYPNMTECVIPESVNFSQEFGSRAFYDMQNLRAVSLPSSVNILYRSFYNCNNLRAVNYSGVAKEAYETFYNCVNLINPILFDDGQMYRTYYNCQSLTEAVCGENTTSLYQTYHNCRNLISPVCGENVTDMTSAYRNCVNLTKAVCGNNVTIMYQAYQNCQNITEAVFGPKVDQAYSAYSNTGVNKAIFTNTMTNVSYLYANCKNITTAVVPPSQVTSMSGLYSGCSNITEAVFSETPMAIDWAYSETNVSEAIVPIWANSINGLYNGCSRLKKAVCPADVLSMQRAYSNCDNLTEGVCGEKVNDMQYAYQNCQNLVQATIGKNVTTAYGVFDNCFHLASVKIEAENPPSIWQFVNVPTDLKVIVPAKSLQNYRQSVWNTYRLIPDGQFAALYPSREKYYTSPTTETVIQIDYWTEKDYTNYELLVNVSSEYVNLIDKQINSEKIIITLTGTNLEGTSEITISLKEGEKIQNAIINIENLAFVPEDSLVIEQDPQADYGFVLNNDGYWESQNQGVNNSYAMCIVRVSASGNKLLRFDCINYAESTYDYGVFSNIDEMLSYSYEVDNNYYHSFRGSQSPQIQTVTYDIGLGEYFICIKFRKDQSQHTGNDSLQFKAYFV